MLPLQTLPRVLPRTSIPFRRFSRTSGLLVRLQPPAHLDEKERHVFEKLAEALGPSRLEVQDISGGCGSMYAIEIASGKFQGLPMMRQHRLVNEVLADEIKGWHGVQLRTKAE